MKATIMMAALVTVTVLFSGCRKKDIEATYVQKIRLTQWPMATSDGETWDLNSAPDVFVKIRENGADRWTAGTVYADAVSGNSVLEFSVSPAVSLNDPDGRIVIECWDQDGDLDADDLMGSLEITPADAALGDDGTVTKSYSGSVAADVTYEFKY